MPRRQSSINQIPGPQEEQETQEEATKQGYRQTKLNPQEIINERRPGASLSTDRAWPCGKTDITVGKITQKLSDVVSKLSDMLGNLGRLSSALTEVGNRASRLAATGAVHLDTAASKIGTHNFTRNMFNGSAQGATDRGIAHAESFTSPSSFNYNVSSGSLDGASNITGDAIKAGNEANKNAAQAAEQWETDQTTAQSRAAQWKAHQ